MSAARFSGREHPPRSCVGEVVGCLESEGDRRADDPDRSRVDRLAVFQPVRPGQPRRELRELARPSTITASSPSSAVTTRRSFGLQVVGLHRGDRGRQAIDVAQPQPPERHRVRAAVRSNRRQNWNASTIQHVDGPPPRKDVLRVLVDPVPGHVWPSAPAAPPLNKNPASTQEVSTESPQRSRRPNRVIRGCDCHAAADPGSPAVVGTFDNSISHPGFD